MAALGTKITGNTPYKFINDSALGLVATEFAISFLYMKL